MQKSFFGRNASIAVIDRVKRSICGVICHQLTAARNRAAVRFGTVSKKMGLDFTYKVIWFVHANRSLSSYDFIKISAFKSVVIF